MTEAAAEARRAYKRQWAKDNPDKVRAYQARYWLKHAAEVLEKPQEESENADVLERK